MNKNSVILIFAMVVLAIGAVISITMMAQNSANNPPASNQPDSQGATTTVETLPEQIDPAAGWLTYTDRENIFSFKYPADFGANVWSPTVWPPAAVFVPDGQDPRAVGCPDIHDQTGNVPAGTPGKTRAGLAYDLYLGSDIGAGQLYTNYCYVFPSETGGAAVIDFMVKSHSACGFDGCGAYCGTQYEAECTNLNRDADIAAPIKKMAESFIFTGIETGTTAPVPSGKTVTRSDNQTNITLAVGDTFLVNLGEGYDWKVAVVDQTIARRVVGIAVIRGAQGVYQTLKPGDTDLTATGDPVCRAAMPPCAAPSVSFEVHLIVR